MALRTPLSVTPHLYMGDSTGRPLDMGTVYFGEQDKDPEFYPINLFSDDALTKPLAQPVHTKGGYLYDKGDMVEPHAKELIYSVKVLDSYGRKVFYKGAMMRNSWNDDVIEQINTAIISSADVARQVAIDITNDAINNTAVEGGVLADTFVVVDGNQSQRDVNQKTARIFNTLSDMLSDSKLKIGQFANTLGYYNLGDSGSSSYKIVDASEQLHNEIYETLNNGLRAKLISRGMSIKASQFGILSTNTAAINTSRFQLLCTLFDDLELVMTELVPINYTGVINDIKLSIKGQGKHTGFFSNSENSYFLRFGENTDVTLRYILVNGGGFVERAVTSSGDLDIMFCEITDTYSTNLSAVNVFLDLANSINKTITIAYNSITESDGVREVGAPLGNSIGACRGVYANLGNNVSGGHSISIRNNYFDNFFGDEGDVVQILDTIPEYANESENTNLTEIAYNYIGRSNRRGVKVQANNVTVINNTFETIDALHPKFNSGAGSISVMSSLVGGKNKGTRILGNIFKNNGGLNLSIYLDSAVNAVVKFNTHYGNAGAAGFFKVFSTCQNTDFSNNTGYGLTPCVIEGGCIRTSVKNNTFYTKDPYAIFINQISMGDFTEVVGNTVYIDDSVAQTFYGFIHYKPSEGELKDELGNWKPFDLRGLNISDNNVYCNYYDAGVARTQRASVVVLPAYSEISVINGRISNNYSDSLDLIYASNRKPDLSALTIRDNETRLGLFDPSSFGRPFDANYFAIKSGTTAQRPSAVAVGFIYFDTTLGKPVYFKSVGVWVDAAGTTV